MRAIRAILAAALSLSGCAIFDAPDTDAPPFPNYPALAVSYRVVPDHELYAICHTHPLDDACAITNLISRTCVIVLKQSYHQNAELVAHEQRHCMGWTHRKGT